MLAYIAYYLGHWISFPMHWFDWGWLYPAYNRLMIWSAELDDEGVIWKFSSYKHTLVDKDE